MQFCLAIAQPVSYLFFHPTGNDLMASLFHISTTDRLTGNDAGMNVWRAFAGSHTVNDETIAPVGRRAR
jgi:hypothetical protein